MHRYTLPLLIVLASFSQPPSVAHSQSAPTVTPTIYPTTYPTPGTFCGFLKLCDLSEVTSGEKG